MPWGWQRGTHYVEKYRVIAATRMVGYSAQKPFPLRRFYDLNRPLPEEFKRLCETVRDEMLGRVGNTTHLGTQQHLPGKVQK